MKTSSSFTPSTARTAMTLLVVTGIMLVQPNDACRVLPKAKEDGRLQNMASLFLHNLRSDPVPPPGNPGGYTPIPPGRAATYTDERAFAGQATAQEDGRFHNTASMFLHNLQSGPVPAAGNPGSYTPLPPRVPPTYTDNRAFAGHAAAQEDGRYHNTASMFLHNQQSGPVPPAGNPGGYTPLPPRVAATYTDNRAFAGHATATPQNCLGSYQSS